MKTLLCVGGPYAGTHRVVPQNGRSLLLPTPSDLWTKDAALDSHKAPYEAVTVETGVYKVEKIGFAGAGFDARVEVLAYYGRDRKDRPEGFFV